MPSIPQSLLWISLVVLWLFVLVPILINKRDTVRRTSDVALATRVLVRPLCREDGRDKARAKHVFIGAYRVGHDKPIRTAEGHVIPWEEGCADDFGVTVSHQYVPSRTPCGEGGMLPDREYLHRGFAEEAIIAVQPSDLFYKINLAGHVLSP